MTVLSLRFCARALSSCSKRGPLPTAVRGLLIAVASLCCRARALGTRASVVVAWALERRLSSCGSRAQVLCGVWDPPRPGTEPVFPTPAGRLSTTVPPGKSLSMLFLFAISNYEFEYLFICLLCICDFLSENYLFIFFAHFSVGISILAFVVACIVQMRGSQP